MSWNFPNLHGLGWLKVTCILVEISFRVCFFSSSITMTSVKSELSHQDERNKLSESVRWMVRLAVSCSRFQSLKAWLQLRRQQSQYATDHYSFGRELKIQKHSELCLPKFSKWTVQYNLLCQLHSAAILFFILPHYFAPGSFSCQIPSSMLCIEPRDLLRPENLSTKLRYVKAVLEGRFWCPLNCGTKWMKLE